MPRFLKIFFVFAIIFFFFLGFFLGRVGSQGEKFKLLSEARDIIKTWFVDKNRLSDEELEWGAIRGMVNSLGDPHSAFLSPDERERMEEAIRGKFEGVGIVITIKDGILTVVSTIENSPAERAGIKAGDKILEIDGVSTLKMSLMEAALRIRGKKGTRVRLKILREGEKEPLIFDIVRAEIILKAVSFRMVTKDIGYIRIEAFRERSYEEFRDALTSLMKGGARALILDLRNNQGGLLVPAIRVLSEFLGEGKLAVYAIDGDGRRQEWRTGRGKVGVSVPLVVLINGGTASASEIVAGALRDYGRAKIIGERSFGKGTINSLFPLSDGSGVYLSYARWFTPKGEKIEGKGISPDIEVEGKEEQLKKAISFLEKILSEQRKEARK